MRLLLLLAIGCEAPQIGVDVGEGLVLLASTDVAGRVEEAALLRSDATNVPLARSKDGFLVSWRLPAGSLIGSDGAPIEESVLRFVPAAEQLEGCGRCLAPSLEAPQTIYSGDLCAPPVFAEVEVFDEEGERSDQLEIVALAREGARLALPGACAYPEFVPESLHPLDVCPLLPEEAPVGTPEVSLAEDGTLMGASAGWVWRVDPAGQRSISEVGPLGDVVLLGALGGTPAKFFYGGTRSTVLLGGYEYFLIDESLRLQSIPDETLTSFRAEELDVVGESLVILRGLRHIGGFSQSVEPEILGCDVGSGSIDCEVEPMVPSDCVLDLPRIHPVNGGAVAIGGVFAYRSAGERVWRCDQNTRFNRVPFGPGVDVEWQRLSYGVGLGSSLFACGRIAATGEGALVHATIPALAPGEDPTGRVTYRIIERGTQCYEVLTLPELPDRVLVVTSTGAIVLDESGAVTDHLDYTLRPLGGGDPLIPELDYLPGGVVQAGDWLASPTGSGFVRRRRGGEPFLPVYAPEHQRDDAALARGEGGSIWWHRGGAAPQQVSLTSGEGCARLQVIAPPADTWTYRTEIMSGTSTGFPRDLSFDQASVAVALDDRRHAVIGPSFRRVVDFGAKTVQQDARTTGGFYPLGAVRMGVDRILILDAGGLYLDSLDTTSAVPLVFDDPSTPEEEASSDVRWAAIDGVDGTAWAVGEGRVVRVVWDGDEPRAEVYWSRRLPTLTKQVEAQNRFRAIDYGAVTVLAPDDALIFSLDVDPSRPNEVIRTVWRISSSPDPSSSNCAGEGPLYICEVEDLEPSVSGRVVRASHARGQLTLFHSTGDIERIGAPRTVSPTWLIHRVVESGPLILMAGYGRLAAAIDRE